MIVSVQWNKPFVVSLLLERSFMRERVDRTLFTLLHIHQMIDRELCAFMGFVFELASMSEPEIACRRLLPFIRSMDTSDSCCRGHAGRYFL